ncbi:hypothetical protein ABT160_39330 [Streptomyces sp. NPDC001941]|uniref:hypothetical protein n=1 Tax=Streptomyces sp. NPDC001941 TaxID=3154659 RepID=UPI0033176072
MAKVLFVSDLSYQARGRRYCDEDIWLTSRLREHFDVALCHPLDALSLMDGFDVVVVRNSGPVIHYQEAYDAFRGEALRRGVRVFNQLSGKADMRGKQYLLEMFREGLPVIPTVGGGEAVHVLPDVEQYVVKPLLGADSIGMEVLPRDELLRREPRSGVLVQPLVPFLYEVSFYFVGRVFHYALHAPDPDARWDLRTYEPTADDLAFAQRFVDWNDVEYGIQRVDACRTPGGELLLVELEDLNPYLSLDLLDTVARERFVNGLVLSLNSYANDPRWDHSGG